MSKTANCVIVVAAAVLLAGCGSTSKMKSASGEKFVCDKQFDAVFVVRFKDEVPDRKKLERSKVEWACGHFADLIVREIEKGGAFASVSRPSKGNNPPCESPLVVAGEITRFVEGSAFARFMVGLGAGSSYFDATVRLYDAKTREVIGVIEVDKNSWGLGGGYASSQTPEKFMEGAAKQIAKQVKGLGKSG